MTEVIRDQDIRDPNESGSVQLETRAGGQLGHSPPRRLEEWRALTFKLDEKARQYAG